MIKINSQITWLDMCAPLLISSFFEKINGNYGEIRTQIVNNSFIYGYTNTGELLTSLEVSNYTTKESLIKEIKTDSFIRKGGCYQ